MKDERRDPALDLAIRVRIEGKQEKFSSALFARRMRMNFAADEPTSESVAQASALQLTLTPGARIANHEQARRAESTGPAHLVNGFLQQTERW